MCEQKGIRKPKTEEGTITITDERERLCRLLSEGDLDEELKRSVERMRRFFFRPWAALDELYLAPDADPSKLERWREAPPHSPEGLKAHDFERAMSMLSFWMGLRGGVPPED